MFNGFPRPIKDSKNPSPILYKKWKSGNLNFTATSGAGIYTIASGLLFVPSNIIIFNGNRSFQCSGTRISAAWTSSSSLNSYNYILDPLLNGNDIKMNYDYTGDTTGPWCWIAFE